MCAPKAPKIKEPEKKPVEVLHNPLLDGSYGVNGLRIGRGALRVDSPMSAIQRPVSAGVVAPSMVTQPTNPLLRAVANRVSLQIRR